MTRPQQDKHMSDPWTCASCGERWVVESLARDCERKHREGKK